MTLNEQDLDQENASLKETRRANPNDPRRGSGNQGFASMDQAKQREIASKGGKAAHESGHAHEFTSEEAREAGRKGGLAAHRNKVKRKKIEGEQSPQTSHTRTSRNSDDEERSVSPSR